MAHNVEEPQVTFLDYIYVWLKWRRTICGTVAAATLLAVIVSLMLPVSYRATTSILPSGRENELGIVPALTNTITAGLNIFGLGQSRELDTYVAILQSRRVRERVIQAFDLQAYYEKDTIDETLKALDGDVDMEITKENTLTLSVIHRDSVKAAAIANFFIDELDRVNKVLSNEQARSNRLFIERRLAKTRQALHKAEEALKAYQEEHRTIGLSQESRAALIAGAELEARMMALEVQRDALKRTLGRTHPLLIQLEAEIEASRRRLTTLPELGLELARLFREVEIQGRLLAFLIPQYEQAKIQEARDTPTVQVIDRAVPPERKYAPKRLFIVLGAALSSLFVSLFLTLSLDAIQQARAGQTPRGQRIDRILAELRSFLPIRRR